MDGVVVDSEPLSIAVIAEVIAEHGGQVDPALLAGLTGVNLMEVLRVAAAHSGRSLDTQALHRSYQQRYLPRLRACAAATPGLARLIAALVGAGVAIGLASSSSLAEIDVVVHALRLRPVLAAVASADEVARPKPAPDVYRLAVRRLGTGPERVVAIEDSATGMAAAHASASAPRLPGDRIWGIVPCWWTPWRNSTLASWSGSCRMALTEGGSLGRRACHAVSERRRDAGPRRRPDTAPSRGP